MTTTDATLGAYRHRSLTRAILIGCAILLVVAVLGSLAIGPVVIPPMKVVGILWDGVWGIRSATGLDMRDAIVVLDIRLPRTLLAAAVGATLAVSGAVMQGIFRNPLADPGIVGVSSGAAFAAVAWIVFGNLVVGFLPKWLLNYTLPFASFAGGLAATILLHRMATIKGRTAVASLLFAGIALGSLMGAATGLIIFVASDQQLREFTFWSLGSLGGASWPRVGIIMPFVAVLMGGALWLARGLDALALGEAEAFHIGVNVEHLKRVAIVVVAAGVGAAVAVSGIIGFVGLVIPHLLRLSAGPAHKPLFIGSALLGAGLLTGSDIFARIVAAPAELPIGIVTALIGAPFFLWLLRRHRATLGA
jgi:iron complex transport system permease protein